MPNLIDWKQLAVTTAFMLTLSLSSATAWSAPNIPASDEDTILVDKQPETKIPYSKIFRAVVYKFFQFDSEQLMTFGGSDRTDIARRFTDVLDRSKTKFKVKEDEVEIEFKVQF